VNPLAKIIVFDIKAFSLASNHTGNSSKTGAPSCFTESETKNGDKK
jgi:hypothetical protein